MKRLWILLSVGALFFCSSNSFAQSKEFHLATGEWPPYVSEKVEGHGPLAQIVTAVFKEMGSDPNYRFYPWKRVEQKVKDGEVFAGFPYVATEKRKEQHDFSDVLFVTTGRLWYIKKRHPQEIVYEKIEDLKGYRISGVLGYWYEEQFKQAKLNVIYVDSEEQSMKMLYNNRADLAPMAELIGWVYIKKLFPSHVDEFTFINKPFVQSRLHLLVSRKYPHSAELVKQFNSALKHIQQKGIYQKILIKYNINRPAQY